MTQRVSTEDFEQLSAYLDGALDSHRQEVLEARLSREPELRTVLQDLQSLQQQLRAPLLKAADPEAVPGRIRGLLAPAKDKVVPFPSRRGGYWRARGLPRFAVAASLVAALGLLLLPQWQDSTPAGSSFSTALETLPSGADGWQQLDDGSRIRPLLSFPHRDGGWCREYLLADGDQQQHGIACRQQGGWETQVAVTRAAADESAAYRPASAGDSDPIAGWVDQNAADIALGAREEAEVIDNRWQ